MNKPPPQPLAQVLPRSSRLWIPFLIPLGLCGISYVSGGMPFFNDLGFLALTLLCSIFLLMEFFAFPRRMGVGGILVFGGVLTWFCYDYMVNWFGVDPRNLSQGDLTATMGKQTFYYCLFVLFMVVGLALPPWRWALRKLTNLPEPATPGVYFLVFMLVACVGFSAFLFSTDPLPITLMKVAFGPWLHTAANFTVYRTGNYNSSWGAYVAQLMDVGVLSGILGAMYASLIARDPFTASVGWIVWGFWVLEAYGGGRRGHLTFVVLPALAFLYLRYQMRALQAGGKYSLRGFVIVGILGLLLLFVVQIQGRFRNVGLGDDVDVSQVSLSKLEGNSMFSEAVPGFSRVPEMDPFFSNSFPGEGALRAMPETLYWFILGPIPRAAWNSKPSDPAMIWYNRLVAGTNGMEGTTIAQGLVGHWYFRFGLLGTIEGAMLVGWLMGMTERILQGCNGRPASLLLALTLMSWLFRIYRNFYFIDLYGPLIGIGVFILFSRISRVFARRADPNPA